MIRIFHFLQSVTFYSNSILCVTNVCLTARLRKIRHTVRHRQFPLASGASPKQQVAIRGAERSTGLSWNGIYAINYGGNDCMNWHHYHVNPSFSLSWQTAWGASSEYLKGLQKDWRWYSIRNSADITYGLIRIPVCGELDLRLVSFLNNWFFYRPRFEYGSACAGTILIVPADLSIPEAYWIIQNNIQIYSFALRLQGNKKRALKIWRRPMDWWRKHISAGGSNGFLKGKNQIKNEHRSAHLRKKMRKCEG